MAERKGDQINKKIQDLENELRVIIAEKNNQYQFISKKDSLEATEQNSNEDESTGNRKLYRNSFDGNKYISDQL